MTFQEIDDNEYQSQEGWRIKREFQGSLAPWVMRDNTGKMIDSDFYINDIAERQKVEFGN